MARETYRDFEPGERLTAKHVNLLNKAARIVSSIRPSSFTQGGSGYSMGIEPFKQRVVIVTDAENQQEVKIKYRYRSRNDGEWQTDDDAGEYLLDATSVGATVANDEILTAWWNPQASRFIPVIGNVLRSGRTTTCHPKGEVRDINMSQEGVDDIPTLNEFADLPEDSIVYIASIDGQYRIVTANPCPDEEPQC